MPVRPTGSSLDSRLFVLDTSALLTLHENEPGAGEVEDIIRQAGALQHVWLCFMSLMEVSYIIEQRAGIKQARQSYSALRQLPLMVLESDEALALAAASIKANYQVSLGDAWIAATAERLGATLVHKDPEFEVLATHISLQALPYKSLK